MEFRTEIEKKESPFSITHRDRIVMLGSCFTDSVGERLQRDGFDVVRNPLGPLYNPKSLANIFERGNRMYVEEDLYEHSDGFHCLDFASRYNGKNEVDLLKLINRDYETLAEAIEQSTVIIITFGTARVYELLPDHTIVGNCHRLPANKFEERLLSINEIVEKWMELIPKGKKTIFTLSPIRYTADGLVNNSLSKAILRVAIDNICKNGNYDYFPAFEILNDDLRDYRFYAEDMKHPTDFAVDYVYEYFKKTYFSQSTIERARVCRKEWQRSLHNSNFRSLK